VVFLAAAPADAAGPMFVYPGKTVSVGAHRSRTVTVTCPFGRFPAGGGVGTSSPRVLVTESSLNSPSWIGTVVNLTGKTQSMTVRTDCIDLAQVSQFASMSSTSSNQVAPAGATTPFTSNCPVGGSKATGGGFIVDTTDPSALIETSKSTNAQDGWTISVSNNSAAPVPVTVQPICLFGGSVTVASGIEELSPNTVRTAVARCPAGQVSGGGFETSSGVAIISSTRPIGLRHRPPGTGWSVRARAGGADDLLMTYAQCVTA
jgi:hypothetical protein